MSFMITQMVTKEEWKPIFFNGKKIDYNISNSGRISNSKGDILKPYTINSGYLAIKLSIENNRHHFLIHRLVAEHFIPNPENKPEVNHKDGNKLNNWSWNLEWNSRNENMQHAADSGLLSVKIGTDSPFAKHSEAQITRACQLLEKGNMTDAEVSLITGVSSNTIRGIKAGKKWKYIACNFDIPKKYSERWDKDTQKSIINLRKEGLKFSDIMNELNLPNNPANRLRASRLVNKVETSTTIPRTIEIIPVLEIKPIVNRSRA